MSEVSGSWFNDQEKPETTGDLVTTLTVAGRHDLTDAQWAVLEPLLPTPASTRPSATLDQAATHQRDPVADPRRYPVARRAGRVRILVSGVCAVPALATRRDLGQTADRVADHRRRGGPDRLGRIGGLHHRAGAPACRWREEKGDLQAESPGGVRSEPADHALGRSRGGLTTTLHLGCEQGHKPLSILVTAGQRGDSPQFIPVIEGIRVPRPDGGRPRTRPDRVLADKAYTSRGNRGYLHGRGIKATIPSKADQDAHRLKRGSKGGRPPGFDPEIYKAAPRSRVRYQPAQTQATRFDKLALRYEAVVHVAAINEWL